MGLGIGIGLANMVASGVSTPAPTLTAIASPLVASGSGGGSSITLQGTHLSGVTGVNVGAASATSVSSTATSVTFTPPANVASATPYNVSATTSGGTATLTGALYSLPTAITNAWYAPQYNAGAGTWTDLVGGVTCAAFGDVNAPSLTASWTNGQPGVTGSSAGTGLQHASTPASAQPLSVFVVCNSTNNTNDNLLFDAAVLTECTGITTSGSSAVGLYAGGSVVASTFNLTATPCLLECYFDSAASSVNQNNGTAQVLAAGANGLTGITLGCRYDGSATIPSTLVGSTGLICLYQGTPTTGDRAIVHGISQAIYGTA